MNLRATPPGEDSTRGARARAVPFFGDGSPPGEDNVTGEGPNRSAYRSDVYSDQHDQDYPTQRDEINFLQLVSEAEDQALLYTNQANRKAWTDSLRAAHNDHYNGSKYNRQDFRNRSKLFIPKTRSAIRKDMAAVSASLFNSMDAISCSPGNEADPKQRASAAVVQELVNYRTNRSSGKAALPWFNIALGARNDALITGICLTKQFWKLELKKRKRKNEDGSVTEQWTPYIDRPDIHLFPPENFIIDSAADWTDPAQSAAFVILKYPMRIDEIKRKQESPVMPWHDVSEELLRTSLESAKYDMAAIRRAREQGLDRFDETQTGYEFQVIWVYECFIRTGGEDWTFWSVGNKEYLTDPTPVDEIYPAHFGERPLSLGYGSLEPHRIFPMSPVESWRPLQTEMNDLRNLTLDSIKQNVMPITKVVRGRQIDLDQVKRRSTGSAIIVTNKDDVTWEQPPQVGPAVPTMHRDLSLELDDLAGQFNGGTTQENNALGRTLGGLKLVAGSANAVQEFDIRVWIVTWADHALSQLVQLEQFYESDPIVLGICGERAQLMEKYGVDKIDNDLLEQEVTISVSIGLGAGDPQARLAKFQTATSIVAPILAQTREFQSGEKEVDVDAVITEVYGAAGYRDGGKRFFKKGQPKPNPLGDLPMQKLKAEIESLIARGKAAKMTGLAALAKVDLGDRALEADNANRLMEHFLKATDMGNTHAHNLHDRVLAATEHGHRHGMAITEHRHTRSEAAKDRAAAADQQQWERKQAEAEAAAQGSDSGGGGDTAAPSPAPAQAEAPEPAETAAPQQQQDPAIGELSQKMDQVIHLLTMLLQPKSGFPANPYGQQQQPGAQ